MQVTAILLPLKEENDYQRMGKTNEIAMLQRHRTRLKYVQTIELHIRLSVIAYTDKRGSKVEIQRGQFNALVENQLPDGSRFLVDQENETVYALNATAGAAWDACKEPTSLNNVTAEMQRSIGSDATEELAQEAILQLQEKNLITASGGERRPTRREVLAKLGKTALPIVVAMTLTEQTERAAYASSTLGSGSSGGSGSTNPCNTLLGFLTHPSCW